MYSLSTLHCIRRGLIHVVVVDWLSVRDTGAFVLEENNKNVVVVVEKNYRILWPSNKNTTSRPQFTLEKSSKWSCFKFSRFVPGNLKRFSLSVSISLVDIVNIFAFERCHENLTRNKECQLR